MSKALIVPTNNPARAMPEETESDAEAAKEQRSNAKRASAACADDVQQLGTAQASTQNKVAKGVVAKAAERASCLNSKLT